jgi:hypothetical protein
MKQLEEILNFRAIEYDKDYLIIHHPYEYKTGESMLIKAKGTEVLEIIKKVFDYKKEDYRNFDEFLDAAFTKNGDGWDYLQIFES